VPKTNTDAELPAFARWLFNERRSRGLTMVVLAERAGISHPRIVQLEKGGTPSRNMVERLASALACPCAGKESDGDALLNAGLKAAGFASESDDPGPIHTIMYERGYHTDELTEEGRDQLRRSLDALIVGIVEQERKARIKKR
jgi:transcriptional regulator with XRE-family HTH domain